MSLVRPTHSGSEHTAIAAGANILRASETGERGTVTVPGRRPNGRLQPLADFEVKPGPYAGDGDPRPACEGADPAIFFPEREDAKTLAVAQVFCNRCPRRAECEEAAPTGTYARQGSGIWGGKATVQRKKR